jgi:aspartate kinase
MEQPLVSKIRVDSNQAKVELIGIQDRSGIASELFGSLKDTNIDMIVQTIGHKGNNSKDITNVAFTLPREDLEKTKSSMEKFREQNSFQDMKISDDVVKISIIGVGMKSHAEVVANALRTLSENSINILMISTSEIEISMIIEEKFSETAIKSLEKSYNL